MTRPPLAPGDRCATYHTLGRRVGTVVGLDSEGRLHVKFGERNDGWFHPKQCRRLCPKPKARAREWSIAVGPAGRVYEVREGHVPPLTMLPAYSSEDMPEWVHVREVLPGKKREK